MDVPEAEKYDGILLNVAQQVGSIDGILDTFFGFLQRKTDFFTGAQDEQAAEQMVMKYYKKHWKAGQKKRQELQEKNRIADEERKQRAEEQKRKDELEYERHQEELAKKRKADEEQPKIEEITEDEAAKIKADKTAKKAEEAKEQEAGESKEKKEEKEEKDAEKEDEAAKDDEDSKEPPPLGNGGKTEKYTWTQTLGALEVYVPVRPGVKAKQIVCDIGTESLKVGIKGESPILDGKMHSKVKTDDCMWTLVDNKVVQITIEKFDGMKWWSCVMQGDPSIDTKKIVPENSKLSDLDGETRMTVEKMMYDQRQKALGKPTSDQEKQHELLEKFKAAHPEMDFSKAKINYGGAGTGSFNFS
mmetsp:Transcript_111890/g.311440  ORF Transcript_111890/g.311440 Transcript_111890/m.311440 type:complete len:359 (+) Transcript_111890:85-1161(+)